MTMIGFLSMLQVVHQHRLIIMDTLNHVQKSRNHENDGFSGFPNNEIGKPIIQNENNYTKLLGYSFHNIYNQDGPPDPHGPQIPLFQSFKDSKFQSVLIYVAPILSKTHCMFSGRY